MLMFFEMAKEMSDKEIERCMSILIEGSVVLSITRDTIQNAIDVTFRVVGDSSQKEYKLSLLPDSVEEISDGVDLRPDGVHLYMQYMVAKGYSTLWLSNMFV